MTDLNTTIALQQGWLFDPPMVPNEYNKGYWHKFDATGKRLYGQGCISPENPPDFKGDARLYMALFEEMVSENKDCHVELSWIPGRQIFWFSITEDAEDYCERDIDIESDSIGTAICQAYCKIHGLDV